MENTSKPFGEALDDVCAALTADAARDRLLAPLLLLICDLIRRFAAMLERIQLPIPSDVASPPASPAQRKAPLRERSPRRTVECRLRHSAINRAAANPEIPSPAPIGVTSPARRRVTTPPQANGQSFFASFCSQKEDSFFPFLTPPKTAPPPKPVFQPTGPGHLITP